MRIVLDTNILLSGIVWKGLPSKIIDSWKEGLFEVVVTDEIFAEYHEVLKRFSGDRGIDVDETMQFIGKKVVWCAPITLSEPACTDPDDDKFVAAGIGGNGEYIVSGDKALLKIGTFGGVEIVTARQFLSILHRLRGQWP